MIHSILGAGGFAGNALVPELIAAGHEVRLVSRHPQSTGIPQGITADLLSLEQTIAAVAGSDVVYLCVGFPYNASLWEEFWPLAMDNAIEACRRAEAKLIFLDVVYMYGRVEGAMTETTPYRPISRKGEVRAKVARRLEDAMTRGEVRAAIARSADVYGPYAGPSSVPHVLVLDNLLKGKPAQWLVDADRAHSYCYTLDVARGLVLLGQHDDALGQVWHLPAARPPITGRAIIHQAAAELGLPPRFQVMGKPTLGLLALVSPKVKETYEMLYQNQYDYVFDSTKFERRFGTSPTPYDQGIGETLRFLRALGHPGR